MLRGRHGWSLPRTPAPTPATSRADRGKLLRLLFERDGCAPCVAALDDDDLSIKQLLEKGSRVRTSRSDRRASRSSRKARSSSLMTGAVTSGPSSSVRDASFGGGFSECGVDQSQGLADGVAVLPAGVPDRGRSRSRCRRCARPRAARSAISHSPGVRSGWRLRPCRDLTEELCTVPPSTATAVAALGGPGHLPVGQFKIEDV
jgi:hypothetical protein